MNVEIVDSEHQRFNGIEYYHSKRGHYQHNQRYLHRDVWTYHNGEIPKGCVVHHKDFNPANNDISNLQLLTRAEHMRLHRSAEAKYTYICAHCGKEFYAADRGRNKFCSVSCTQKYYYYHGELFTKTCEYCGKTFQTRSKNARFCSNYCVGQSYSAEHSLTKICPVCGKEFKTLLWRNAKTCSRSCGAKLGRQKQLEII